MKLLVSISFLSIDLLYLYASVLLKDRLQLDLSCRHVQRLLHSFRVTLDSKNSLDLFNVFFSYRVSQTSRSLISVPNISILAGSGRCVNQ